MVLKILDGEFTVGQATDFSEVDFQADFLFLAKTDEEVSIVCRTKKAPANLTAAEYGWRAFRIEGQLDFSLVGILARIASILARQQISVFVVSTFRTDYVLVKSKQLALAIDALTAAGYVCESL